MEPESESAEILNDVVTSFHVGKYADCLSILAEISAASKCGKSIVGQCLLENNLVVCTYKEQLNADVRIGVSERIDRLSKISVTMQGLPPSLKALPVELAISFNTSALLLQQVNHKEPVLSSLNQICQATDPVSTAWSCIQKITIANLHRVLCTMGTPESRPDIERLLGKITGIAHLVPTDVISLVTLQCCLHSLGHMIVRQHQDALRILEEVLKMNPRKNQDDNQTNSSSAFLMDISIGSLTVDLSCRDSLLHARDLAGFLLVACLFQTGQWDDCLHHINTKLSDLPDSLKLTNKFIEGYCLYQTGHSESAIKTLTSLAESPDTDVALRVKTINLIGCCLATLNKPYTAIQKFQEALKMDFSFLCPLYNISVVFRHLGLQDAEIEALHLLIKAVKDKNPSMKPPEADIILGSLPSNALNNPDGGYILDEQSLNVLFVMYTLAQRCLELGRFNDAAKKYHELLRVIEDDLSPSTKHPMDCKEDSSCVPPLHTIFLEAALSFYKTNDIEQSLTITDRVITKIVPTIGNTTRTSDLASHSRDADADTRRQTERHQTDNDALPGPSFQGSGSGGDELDLSVALSSCSRDEPGNTRSNQMASTPELPSDIPFRSPDVSIKAAKGHLIEETEISQESGVRLFIANALLLKSSCLIQMKNWPQAFSITKELLEYLSGVSRTEDQCDEIGSRYREAECKMEGGGDDETPRSKKRKTEPTHGTQGGETRRQQPIRDSLLEVKAKAYNNKAMILIGQKKTSEALHMLVLGTQCSPDDSDVLYNYILLLSKMGRPGEARKMTKKLLVLETSLKMSPLLQYLS
ncbi:uncharacterized protein LOC119730305 isoform X2 [Patiria miniata]|uniref:Uncharacterized protein n=1 Tax=Patiria miniata TaxID=46514 RepID=A0A914A5C6_PATMI|nr:uncharacterized protein LOC119730305 isoform X2 [Patiria miniata]